MPVLTKTSPELTANFKMPKSGSEPVFSNKFESVYYSEVDGCF